MRRNDLVQRRAKRRRTAPRPLTTPRLAEPTSAHPVPAADKTLTKGLQVLELLCAGDGSRGISDLADELSLTKSNVHRLLQTLRRCGYVVQDAETERYRLSSKLWRLARGGRPFEALGRLVRPLLKSLTEATGESTVFALVESDDLVIIDQVETDNPVRVVFFSVGQRFAIDRTVAPGRALTALQLVALAHRSDAEVRQSLRIAEAHQPAAAIARTVAGLAGIRTAGFAISRGEWVSGVNAVAVAVMDPSRAASPFGVLSCFGPADRVTEPRLQAIQRALSLKARELSQLIMTDSSLSAQ
jgi:IclR family transcriptional regulator, KDG regulon repressor